MTTENSDIWFEGADILNFPCPVLPSETEILIIGGGMAGITTAYLLSKSGKKVILLEKGKLGRSVTKCTTGFLTSVIDTDPETLIKKFGKNDAKLIQESHKNAIEGIEKIIDSEKIDCELEYCTNYIYANNRSEERILPKLAQSYRSLGIDAEYKKENKIKFNDLGYVEMKGHAKFNAIKYLFSLAKISADNGAIIAEDTEVLNLIEQNNYVSVEIKDVGTIKTKKVISATYVPFHPPKYLSHLANMYREYVIEYKIPKGFLELGTYVDMRLPYNYFRIDGKNDFDRLIIGGADHLDILKIDREINHRTMEKYAEKLFSSIKLEEVRHWTGEMLETNDGLAFVGNTRGGNIYYIFGFSGNGMTYSYISGKILSDELMQKDNPYKKIYDIDRKIPWWKILF